MYIFILTLNIQHIYRKISGSKQAHSLVLKVTLLKAAGPGTNQLRRRHHWLIEKPLEGQGSGLGKRLLF